ncbi:MAG: division/cell wall cluster transcriptional repressor MraZ [Verrucomicrobiaceae bacterium]
MAIQIQAQRGIVEHKLDAKGRVSVPVTWRPPTGQSVFLLRATSYGQPALRVLSEDAFSQKLQQIEEAEALTPRQKDNATGMLYANSVEASVNEQGKLLVPKAWAEERELTLPGAVTLVGRGNHFEMLSPANAEAMQAAEKAENEELNQMLNLF